MTFNDNNKNNLNLTPRTHISIETNEKINSSKWIKPKKLDSVEIGLKKLIFLGKIIKNYFPHKENFMRRKAILEMKNSNSNKKLTPFQIYQKNKKLQTIQLNMRRNPMINLKTVNSEKNVRKRSKTKNNIIKNKNKVNLNTVNFHNNLQNGNGCTFKNKLIKSVFEKSKNKNKNNSEYKTLNYTESNYYQSIKKNNKNRKNTSVKDLIKLKYLLSYENMKNNNMIKNIKNDFLYEKEKKLLLNKQNILKKKKNINLFNEIKLPYNKSVEKTVTEESNRSIYHYIPIIDLQNFNKSHDKFYDIFIKNSMRSNIFNKQIKAK